MGSVENVIKVIIGVILIFGLGGGFLLVLDEYCMIPVLSLVLIPLFELMGIPCHSFGDWTWLHDIFVGLGVPDWWHHWISGIVLMFLCGLGLVGLGAHTLKKRNDRR